MADLRSLLRSLDPREQFISIPHWLERTAAGVIPCDPHWLTDAEGRAVSLRRREIDTTRQRRRAAKCVLTYRRSGSVRVRYRGLILRAHYDIDAPAGRRVLWSSHSDDSHGLWPSRRDAARALLHSRPRSYGRYTLTRSGAEWRLYYSGHLQWIDTWGTRPHRTLIARAIRVHRASLSSRSHPDTLGWRAWRIDGTRLVSPHMGTPWDDAELRVERWDDSDALRGVAGIHARRLPRNWRLARWSEGRAQEGPAASSDLVHGIVERYGRYVLGSQGWRAEWVIIRELMAPDVQTMLTLIQAYPDVRVHLSPHAPAVAHGE